MRPAEVHRLASARPLRSACAAVLTMAVCLLVGWAAPAGAHAVLQSTSPSDGAQLDVAPEEIVLQFSEPVSAPSGALRVVNASGDEVHEGSAAVDGSSVRVDMEPSLGEGAYIASYHVVSADGHPIQGAFGFTVGDASPLDPAAVAAQSQVDAERAVEVGAGIARWLAYAGALLAAGGAAYRVAVDRGATGPGRGALLVRVAASVAAIGLLAEVPLRAHLVSGDGASALFEEGVASAVLGDGVAWALGVSLAGLGVVSLSIGAAAARRRVALVAGAAAIVVGFALTGHTNTSDPRWAVTGADVVHLAAAAIWFGGLVFLGRRLWSARRSRDALPAGGMVARFSTMATAATGAVVAAGLVLGWSEVGSVGALADTGYGQLLLVKVAVVAPIALAGGYNRFRLVPTLADHEAGGRHEAAWRHLRGTVTFEAAGMLAVLALTAALVNVTPGRAETPGGDGSEAVTVPLGDTGLEVEVLVDPATAGPAEIHLTLLDSDGALADADPEQVTVELVHPGAGIGPIQRRAEAFGPAQYHLERGDLTVAGEWEIGVIVRLSTFEQARAATTVTLGG